MTATTLTESTTAAGGIRGRLAAAEPNALVRLALRLDAVVTGANVR